MPIRRAIHLIFLCCLVLPALVAGMVAATFALKSHSALESATMEERIRHLEHTYNQQLKGLEALSTDWAQWDDAIRFADTPNDSSMRAWLTAFESFGNQRLALAAFVRPDLTLIYGASADLVTQTLKELPRAPGTDLLAVLKKIVPGQRFGENRRGVFIWRGTPYSFAAVPILDINRGSPGKGFLVLARVVDPAFWAYLMTDSTLTINSTILTDQSATPNRGIDIQSEDLRGVTTFNDSNGKPLLEVSVTTDRGLFKQVEHSRTLFVLFLGFLGGLSMTATFALLNRKLTKRVEGLQRDSGAIEASGDFSLRVEADANDEIGKIGTSTL